MTETATRHDWPAFLKAMEATEYPSGRRVGLSSYRLPDGSEEWTVLGSQEAVLFVRGQYGTSALHETTERAEMEGSRGLKYEHLDRIRRHDGPVLVTDTVERWRGVVGPPVPAPAKAIDICKKCDGTGEVECDMGHDHDCPKCDGQGGSEKEPEWTEMRRVRVGDKHVDSRIVAVVLATVAAGPMTVSLVSAATVARLAGDGWAAMIHVLNPAAEGFAELKEIDLATLAVA